MIGCMFITSSKFRNSLSQFLVSWLKFQSAEELIEIKSITTLKLLNLLVPVPFWRQIIGKSQEHKKTFPDFFLMGDNLEEHYQLKKWPWPSCQLFRRYSFHFLSLNSFILLWKHNPKDIAQNSIQHLFLWETWRKDLNFYFVCLLLPWL